MRQRFQAWNLSLAPGATRATTAAEWAGALVVVECGTLRVDCLAGASITFIAGDHLALGWLPVQRLHNVGSDEMRLVAVRRDSGSIVDSINGAKSDETRQRRIAKSIAMLHEGRIR
jgi:hypothetical protein